MIDNIFTLVMLILLQAVLGFDNLLYISLESKRAPLEKQKQVRFTGILIAMALRIALLFILTSLISYFQNPILDIHWSSFVVGHFNIHSLIVLGGGVFIIYTAMNEIWHLISMEEGDNQSKKPASTRTVIAWIVIMNLVFSFDSILSAMALTNVFWIMATAIIISGLLMIWVSDRVSSFLQKNKMYEVLGLFVLFIVGIMLISEGGHLSHLELFGNEITPMNNTTFYFILFILIIVDIVQGRYQKKLDRQHKIKNT